jgi:hypothetical protein
MHRISSSPFLALAGLLSLGFFPLAVSAGGAPSGGLPAAQAPRSSPSLSFICLGPDRTTAVTCRLTGRGFRHYERVQVTYSVKVGIDMRRVSPMVYHRTSTTDAAGSFTRPPLWVRLDGGSLYIQVTATGAAGDHATAFAAGPA